MTHNGVEWRYRMNMENVWGFEVHEDLLYFKQKRFSINVVLYSPLLEYE